jgi:hypothetical protein
MNTAQYAVEIQEHDSTPWSEPHLYTRAGAWKRVLACAAKIEAGWPHPVWARVWRMHSKRTQDGVLRKCRVLVYTGDLRHVKSST